MHPRNSSSSPLQHVLRISRERCSYNHRLLPTLLHAMVQHFAHWREMNRQTFVDNPAVQLHRYRTANDLAEEASWIITATLGKASVFHLEGLVDVVACGGVVALWSVDAEEAHNWGSRSGVCFRSWSCRSLNRRLNGLEVGYFEVPSVFV